MGDRTYDLTIALGRVALRALDVTTRVHGAEHLPRTGPAVMASVHVGYPDFLFVGKAGLEQGRHVRFLCRHDIWHSPVAAPMTAMGHVPVDREAPAAAYLQARRLLRAGEVVCGFPEAGISWSYTVRSLMRGLPALARETGAPLVPVAVWGTQRMWSVGLPVDGRKPAPSLRRGRVVDVAFGEPMGVAPGDDLVTTTRRLGHVLTGLLEDLQQRPEHRPRPGERAVWHPAHLGGAAPDREAARAWDSVPRAALAPTWGPGTEPGGRARLR
ncbi:lysophospholipid acyltransferase family protein [Nocardioides kribbensis]|uniref:lysophospholipid acyltransferase family protein n=2 Tax=Nocardioides kribbensis TaxID=305517 RepID=UPI0032DBC896